MPSRGFLALLGRLPAVEALRHRSFRLMTYAHASNMLGAWMDEVTRGWLIYQLTDSVVQLGLVRGIQAVPLLLLSPLAGSFADRHPARTLLAITQAASASVYVALALLVFTGTVQPWHLYAAAVLIASLQVYQQPAQAALTSTLVPPAALTNAIGVYAIAFNVSRSLGPAIAGAVIVLGGTQAAYSIQAAVLALAALCTSRIPAQPPAPRTFARPASFARSIAEGWRFSWRSEEVRAALMCTMLASFLVIPFIALLPVFSRDLLAVGADGQGLLLTAMGIGALASAALIAGAGHRLARGRLMLMSTMAYGLIVIVFAVSPWFALSLAMMALIGLCHVHCNALVMTIIQSYSPHALRGRTMALFNMNQVMVTVGAIVAGNAAGLLGPRWAVAAMGAAGFAAMLAMYVWMPRARLIK